jgi:hypothetical protein
MNDFTIADIAVHFAASKNKHYRENITTLFATLARFLQINKLTTRELLTADEVPYATFKIRRSDLTDEGFELIKQALDQWVKGIVTGKWLPTDTSVLRRELACIRGSKPE